MTIKEVKELLAGNPTQDQLAGLASDPRTGVQKLLLAYQRRMLKLKKKQQDFAARFEYEKRFWADGKVVAGIDEVGRGPLAGPIVTCAVILDENFDLLDVNDSKKLTPKRRRELYPQILAKAVDVSIGVGSPALIDRINVGQADLLAMKQAVEGLKNRPDELLVDAMKIPIAIPQTKLIKGDSKSNSIAAASIVAKVFRDNLMDDYAKLYPAYNFNKNAGYGTADHLAALKEFGPTPIHRKTFAPVSDFY